MRDQPPSIQDGKFGLPDATPDNFDRQDGEREGVLTAENAKKIARESWNSSTSWLNAARRGDWSNSLRAFASDFPQGSKYTSGAYQHRSKLYRPKTRAMVRRDEAATASAFFSNEDVVSIQAADDDDPNQQASAEVLKALLQYRLTKSIPWFLTLVGARQDADVMGVCAAKAYWKYEERKLREEQHFSIDPASGMLRTKDDGTLQADVVEIMEKLHDKPVVDLISPENIRISPAADWRAPVQSSPYVIEAIPMFIQDVRNRIAKGDWLPVSESALRASSDLDDDPTRRARENGRPPGKDNDVAAPGPFSICWVNEVAVRWGDEDWHYFCLNGTCELLTNPEPLKEVYLHGERPWVLGHVIVEAHKPYPTSKVELIRDLQMAANDDWNLRFDNLKMTLNPRQLVKTGAGVDLGDLRLLIPGKSVMVKDPTSDVVWDRPPPPAAEAYAEADRINLDFDELTGAFSNSSVQSSQIQQQSATGMHLMSGEASGISEYELRVFAETFVEPLLRLMIKLEQAYETDPVILSLAGKRAQLMTKFGVNGITDELLQQEVTTRVNVGIGATNPAMKLRNFVMAGDLLGKLFGPALAMGLNAEEVMKEVFALSGYKDGARFLLPGFDPGKAMQQMAAAKAQKPPPAADPSKVQAAQIQSQGRLQETQIKSQTEMAKLDKEFAMQQTNDQNENFRAMLAASRADQQARMRETQQAVRSAHPLLAQLG